MVRTMVSALSCALLVASVQVAEAQPLPPFNWTTPPERPNGSPGRMVYYMGNDLFDLCQKNEFACIVFIQGVADGQMSAVWGTNRDVAYCIPQGSTGKQVKDVVVAYLAAHPESRHFLASTLVAAALAQAWPQCP
jgi:Rap1a immunity proteins